MKHSLFAMLIALLYACTLHAQNRHEDSLALKELYCLTNGFFWIDTWDLDTLGTPPPMDEWYGVGTTSINGELRVTSIDLHDNNLSGILPDLNLTELTYLNLFNNQLISTIPDFSQMSDLQNLNLSNNYFIDAIPNFTNLNNLINLNLSNNKLTGNVPSFDNLMILEQLYLGENNLTDSIPNLNHLVELTDLALNNNHLDSIIPTFESLINLKNLSLNNNHFTGEIPDLNHLTVLTRLNLGNNRLEGNVPEFEGLQQLQFLYLNNNYLQGNIPDFNLPELRTLHLGSNILDGVILEFENLDMLEELYLNSNQLEGEIPNFDLPTLRRLRLDVNNLTGEIPDFNLQALERLWLGDNNLIGEIPDFNLQNLTDLWLGDNSLADNDIPSFNGLPNLINLNLQRNYLSGSIPPFNQTNLQTLYLSSNRFSGAIPNFNLVNLRGLDLRFNKLEDEIPAFEGLINPDPDIEPLIQTIYLSGNNLTGSIPSNFANFTNLTALDVSYNQLSDCYPNSLNDLCEQINLNADDPNRSISEGNNFEITWMEFCNNISCTTVTTQDCDAIPEIPIYPISCQELDTIILRRIYCMNNGPNWANPWNWYASVSTWEGVMWINGCVTGLDLQEQNLTGDLSEFNGLTNLTNLDLSDNNLSGSLPNFNLPQLTNLNLRNNNLSGSLPDFNLPQLVILNLCDNSLSDSIPDFNNLPNLGNLGLCNNNLIDTIPDFSGIELLTNLELWGNNLSGNIPNFSNLPNLGNLALNTNNLSDAIPNFSGLENLVNLDLENNNLSDTIPNFSNLPILENLILSGNNLTGSIPNFNDLPLLTRLRLGYNNLSGTIPIFGSLLELTNLELHHNNLTGEIPDFDHLLNLWQLGASFNNLTGSVPDFNLPMLERLYLNNNNLSGNIPNFNNLPDLRQLYLSHNILSGEIPDFDQLNLLEVLSLNDNILQGSIPNFNFPNLRSLNLSRNILTGEIPNFQNLNQIRTLFLRGNNLTGNIPSSFGNMNELGDLRIENNQLSGCYEENLMVLCTQLIEWSSSNTHISNGNAFKIPWEDFCAGTVASCDTFDLAITLDTTNITSCDNNDGSIFLQAQFGSPPYYFQWDDPAINTFSLDGLSEGIYTVTVTDCKGGMAIDSVELKMPFPPTIDSIDIEHTYCGEPTGSFTVHASGGTLPYEYSINNGGFQPDSTFSDLIDGQYTIYVTDVLRCTIDSAIVLLNSTEPVIDIDNVILTPTCADESNGSIEVTDVINGTEPFEYSIDGTNFQPESLFLDLSHGTYTLTVRDSLDCLGSLDLEILALPVPVIVMPIDTTSACGGNEGIITIEVEVGTGTPPFMYSIDGGTTYQTDSVFLGLTGGTYDIVVQDDSMCTSVTEQTTLGIFTSLSISTDITDATCQVANGQIIVNVTGGIAPYEYRLDGILQNNDTLINLSGNNTYTILVYDAIGCTIETTATVGDTELPQIDNIDIVDAECELPNGSIAIFASSGTPPYEYSLDGINWENSNTFIDLRGDTTYNILVRDAIECMASTTATLSDTPQVSFTTVSGDPMCGQPDGFITINAFGTPPYMYDCGYGNTPEAGCYDLSGGEYPITVTDAVGCQATALVVLAVSDTLKIDSTVISEPCLGEENCGIVQLTLSGWNNPYVVGWTPLGNGIYEGCVPTGTSVYTIKDADGCEYEYSISFPEYEYQASVTPSSVVLDGGDTITFFVAGTMQAEWLSEDEENLNYLTCNDCLSPRFTAPIPLEVDMVENCQRNINYQVVAYNDNGNCTDTLTVSIIIRNKIYIPVGITPNDDDYNNELVIPALAAIAYDDEHDYSFDIFNRWGELVYTFKDDDGDYANRQWDGNYYKNGVEDTGRKLPDATYYYNLKFTTGCRIDQDGSIFIR